MATLVSPFAKHAVFVFSMAQVLSSLFYAISYWTYFAFVYSSQKYGHKLKVTSIRQFLPQKLQTKPFLDTSLLIVAWTFLKQGAVKQLLTEGERMVMTIFNPLTFAEQGVYDVVNNLGSLAARFILQPIEESSYLVFGQFLDRNKPPEKQVDTNVRAVGQLLRNLLRAMILLGSFIFVFGFNYSELALQLYGGHNLSGGIGPTLLRWHCVYVFFIAVNGITECFTFAAMNQTELNLFNQKLVFLSIIFLSSAYLLTLGFGSPGFIMSNCLNMSGRVVFSILFITRYFRETKHGSPLKGCLPNVWVILSMGVTFSFLRVSEALLCCEKSLLNSFLHIIVGIIFSVIIFAVIYLQETELITFIKSHWKRKGNDKKSE
jgi:oligosaccharide translocation protein RFT1